MINGKSLNSLESLLSIEFYKDNYRDMIYKNGIKWIRDLNPDLNVNLNNLTEILNNEETFFIILSKLKIILLSSKTVKHSLIENVS